MTSEFHCENCGARVHGSRTYVENVADSHVCPMSSPRLSRTTPSGAVVYVDGTAPVCRVVVDHPDRPAEFRHRLVGWIDSGGFTPNKNANTVLGPEVLRALADLVEELS